MTDRRGDVPPSLRDLLRGVGARIGIEDTRATGAVWARWPEIVGESIAANAEPTSLRNGVLRIRATSPGWATELTYLADDISRRANEIAGRDVVREVRVWTGPGRVRHTTTRAPEAGLDGAPDGTDKDDPQDLATALERARSAWARRVPKRPR